MSAHTRHLLLAWLMLMGLSLALAIAADVRTPSRLHPAFMGAIGVVVLAKCWIILRDYLELGSHRGMLKGLISVIALTVLIVIASFVLITP